MLESFEIIIQLLYIPKNILLILFTLLVLKLDISNEFNEEQPEKHVTHIFKLLVLKLDKFNVVNLEHS